MEKERERKRKKRRKRERERNIKVWGCGYTQKEIARDQIKADSRTCGVWSLKEGFLEEGIGFALKKKSSRF